jgi:hypothetical protein
MSHTSASPVATPTSDDLSEDSTAENPMSIQDNAESDSALASSVTRPIEMLSKSEDHNSSHSIFELISTSSKLSEQGDASSIDTESMNRSVQPSRNEASPDNSPPSNIASHSGLHTNKEKLRVAIQDSYVQFLTADSIVVKNLTFSKDPPLFLPYTINLSSNWATTHAELDSQTCDKLWTQARMIVGRIRKQFIDNNAKIRNAICNLYNKCGMTSEGSQATEPVDKNLDQYSILQSLANSVHKENKLDSAFNLLIFSAISMMMAQVDRAKVIKKSVLSYTTLTLPIV